MRLPRLVSLSLPCVLLLGACSTRAPHTDAGVSSLPAPPPAAAPAAPVKIANPASVYCIQQGGRLRMEKTPQGEHMLCILPGGRAVEEWEYFRQHHPAPRP